MHSSLRRNPTVWNAGVVVIAVVTTVTGAGCASFLGMDRAGVVCLGLLSALSVLMVGGWAGSRLAAN